MDALYFRVSSERQTTENQFEDLVGAAAEFERELIREKSKAGRARYLQDYRAGRVGKTVRSRSGKNLAPHRPKRIFDRDRVADLRAQRLSIRRIATKLCARDNVLACSCAP